MEREVRANLVYRMFTRIDAGDVRDAKTILKIARTLGREVIEQLHRQVVEVAKRAGVTHDRRFNRWRGQDPVCGPLSPTRPGGQSEYCAGTARTDDSSRA